MHGQFWVLHHGRGHVRREHSETKSADGPQIDEVGAIILEMVGVYIAEDVLIVRIPRKAVAVFLKEPQVAHEEIVVGRDGLGDLSTEHTTRLDIFTRPFFFNLITIIRWW